ncbi:ladderlectin-like isoform X1 [Trachinotus anak]|uniref:ladderlectin-like isoform X1 n=1 Tax=Trachinotus anak TaxID=443729 RepID=UPI0039F1EA5B
MIFMSCSFSLSPATKMQTGCLLVCAMVALTVAEALPEEMPGQNQTAESHLVKRSIRFVTGWSKIKGRRFHYVPKPMTWAQAERNCQSMGANLASVHSVQEYSKLQRLIFIVTHDYKETWIGGSDAQGERIWFWSDGSRFHYSHWCQGEPNNSGGRQHCLQMNFGAAKCWDDVECSRHRPSICVKRRW